MLLSEAQLNEFLGLSREEKLEKLKKSIEEYLAKNKIELEKLYVHDDKMGTIEISAYIKSVKGEDFGGAGARVYYYPKDKCARIQLTAKEDKPWIEYKVTNTPASCIYSLIVQQIRAIRMKRENDRDASAQRDRERRNEWDARKREIEQNVDNWWAGKQDRNYIRKYHGAYNPDKSYDLE